VVGKSSERNPHKNNYKNEQPMVAKKKIHHEKTHKINNYESYPEVSTAITLRFYYQISKHS